MITSVIFSKHGIMTCVKTAIFHLIDLLDHDEENDEGN